MTDNEGTRCPYYWPQNLAPLTVPAFCVLEQGHEGMHRTQIEAGSIQWTFAE